MTIPHSPMSAGENGRVASRAGAAGRAGKERREEDFFIELSLVYRTFVF
jgi:hypothetical protein